MLRNVGILVLTYALAFIAVQASQRLSSDWRITDFAFLVADLAGIVCAMIFRARIAAYVIAVFAVSQASELVLHSIYGIRSVQSAPVHFAVMLAAALGLGLGAWMRKDTSQTPFSPDSHGLVSG